jgi:hypothetical protein
MSGVSPETLLLLLLLLLLPMQLLLSLLDPAMASG